MQSVKDNEGRPWIINMTTATALRIRDSVSVAPDGGGKSQGEAGAGIPFDVLDVATFAQTITTLRSKFHVLAETLWAVVKPQAEPKGVSREDFLESLGGDGLDAMGKALIDELVAFFPSGHRPILALMREKLDEWSDAVVDAASKQLESVTVGDMATVAAFPAAVLGSEVRS